MNADTLIQEIKPQHTLDLRRLFVRAVDEDFNYFPAEYQSKVLRDNNLPHLMVAALRPSRIMFGVQRTGRLIGYIIAGTNADASGKIYWLYVSPDGRGQNLGRLLLERALRQMHHRGLQRVSLVTHNYGDYYRRFGFTFEKAEKLYGVPMNVMSYQWPK